MSSQSEAAARHRRVLQEAGMVTPAMLVVTIGQSNRHAHSLTPASDVSPTYTVASQGYYIQHNASRDFPLIARAMTNGTSGTSGLGNMSMLPRFANVWTELTGEAVLAASYAYGGTPFAAASLPTRHWEPTPIATSMLGDVTTGADKARSVQFDEMVDAITLSPGLDIRRRVCLVQGGESDCGPLAAGTITQAGLEQSMHDCFDYLKANWGIDYFFLTLIGRIGVDVTEIADNETNGGVAGVRAAQAAVAAARPDTFVTNAHAVEQGSPFNTLTVDGGGLHVSGWELKLANLGYSPEDGTHWTMRSYYYDGDLTARNGATALEAIDEVTLL